MRVCECSVCVSVSECVCVSVVCVCVCLRQLQSIRQKSVDMEGAADTRVRQLGDIAVGSAVRTGEP